MFDTKYINYQLYKSIKIGRILPTSSSHGFR